jgi:hypothetical protein
MKTVFEEKIDLDIDYAIGFHPEDETKMAIKITSGKFKDIIFSISKVNIDMEKEESGEETPKLSLEYDILTGWREGIEEDEGFNRDMASIVIDIITTEAGNRESNQAVE